jgi:uncharacterized membrane protein YgcG
MGVMLGPISAIDVARTSMKLSDPARKELERSAGSVIHAMLGDGTPSSPRNFATAKGVGAGTKRFLSGFGLAAGLAASASTFALPATAATFVQDQAGLFSAGTVAELNERISNFNAQTGKEIVVITTPSLNGATLQQAATNAFSQQNVNGVLVFIARDDRRDIILPDSAGVAAGWFPSDTLREIRGTMEAQFRAENYDGGITGTVTALLGIYRAHAGGSAGSLAVPAQGRFARAQGMRVPMFFWIVGGIIAFLIVRSLLRAASAPRSYGPGAPPAGQTPPSGPGYGPGYGYGYGGGSFWSGLLGGLGGAWLGNELFRGGGGGEVAPTDSGGGWGGGAADSGGWQSDAGQAGISGASSGDFSGGGFGGDAGGGDFGGGGGDGGGGW